MGAGERADPPLLQRQSLIQREESCLHIAGLLRQGTIGGDPPTSRILSLRHTTTTGRVVPDLARVQWNSVGYEC